MLFLWPACAEAFCPRRANIVVPTRECPLVRLRPDYPAWSYVARLRIPFSLQSLMREIHSVCKFSTNSLILLLFRFSWHKYVCCEPLWLPGLFCTIIGALSNEFDDCGDEFVRHKFWLIHSLITFFFFRRSNKGITLTGPRVCNYFQSPRERKTEDGIDDEWAHETGEMFIEQSLGTHCVSCLYLAIS